MNNISVPGLADVPLIPRTHFFGNPQKTGVQLSRDGRYLSWSAPYEGVMNIWVAEREHPERAWPVTQERKRGILSAIWAYDGTHLLYGRDKDGDENHHIYAVNLDGSNARDLTPYPDVRASVIGMSQKAHLRGKVLIAMNRRDPRFSDRYVVDIASGNLELLIENQGFSGFLHDDDFRALLAFKTLPDGGSQILKIVDTTWTPWLSFSAEDARGCSVSHMDAKGEQLYIFDNRGRDTRALVSIPLGVDDANSVTPKLIAQDLRADIGGLFIDLETHQPLAYSVTYERNRVHLLTDALAKDIAFLDGQKLGEWGLTSRTEDDRYWIVGFVSDTVPGATYLYDRQAQRISLLYLSRPELLDAPLARMQSLVIRSRDGLDLVSYLTLPRHVDAGDALVAMQPVPLVLLVHGGPWVRDSFGYNANHQWLANRGYAVLSVNYRGSTGFGKRFAAAVEGEWGGKMDDDLCDAVDWVIAKGIADPKRIAIMGASYGGYATLWALTHHPDRYACGVDMVGPANLETLLASTPAYWESARAMLYKAIGNPETEEGRALLRERSPLHYAKNIRKPLLIGQGANDPRVKQAESDQMVAAIEEQGIPYTYALFPDEGHGLARPANRIKFNILTEEFLAQHLAGRFQTELPREAEGHTAIIKTLA